MANWRTLGPLLYVRFQCQLAALNNEYGEADNSIIMTRIELAVAIAEKVLEVLGMNKIK